jgi:hypothetical protein
MTGLDANTQDTRPAVTTHPFLGVAGVLLGALIATCTARLMSVGLDIRGTFHLGVDEGSWINAAFNASMMFLLLATGCVVCPVVVSFMSKVPTQYRQVTAAPVEAK